MLQERRPSNQIVVCGDVSIDTLDPDNAGSHFIELMHSFSFFPCISLLSRVAPSSSSLIDHVWRNALSVHDSGVLTHDVTDHYYIFVLHPFLNSKKTISKSFRDHSQGNLSVLYNDVTNFISDFHRYEYLDVQSLTNLFHGELYNLYDKHCPNRNKIISFKRFCNPWLDSRIMQLINRIHKLFRLYKMGVVSLGDVNEFKSFVGGQIRSAMRKYFKNKLDMCSSNSSKIWKIYNNILGKERKSRDIDCY